MPVTVHQARTATPELAAALQQLLPQLTGTPAHLDELTLARVLAQPALTLLIAQNAAGQIIGTATLIVVTKTSGRVAQLEDVVVDADARGQGVGASLTAEAIRLACADGAEHLDLTSSPHRQAANRLYQRLGFVRRETNVYRHPLTP